MKIVKQLFYLPILFYLSNYIITIVYQLKTYQLINLVFALFISDDLIILIYAVTAFYK